MAVKITIWHATLGTKAVFVIFRVIKPCGLIPARWWGKEQELNWFFSLPELGDQFLEHCPNSG